MGLLEYAIDCVSGNNKNNNYNNKKTDTDARCFNELIHYVDLVIIAHITSVCRVKCS